MRPDSGSSPLSFLHAASAARRPPPNVRCHRGPADSTGRRSRDPVGPRGGAHQPVSSQLRPWSHGEACRGARKGGGVPPCASPLTLSGHFKFLSLFLTHLAGRAAGGIRLPTRFSETEFSSPSCLPCMYDRPTATGSGSCPWSARPTHFPSASSAPPHVPRLLPAASPLPCLSFLSNAALRPFVCSPQSITAVLCLLKTQCRHRPLRRMFRIFSLPPLPFLAFASSRIAPCVLLSARHGPSLRCFAS